MVGRLTTSVKIANSADAILQRVIAFKELGLSNYKDGDIRSNIGIDPMLLALSMELALKAWFVFDHDSEKVIKTHNLSKLFEGLTPESQEKLDFKFRESVAIIYPNCFYADYGIRQVLYQHQNAFTDWRYVFEPMHARFETSVFIATLEMVLSEFHKRYYTVPVRPI